MINYRVARSTKFIFKLMGPDESTARLVTLRRNRFNLFPSPDGFW